MLIKIPKIPFDFQVLAVMFLALGITHLTSRVLPREATWTVSGVIIIAAYMYFTNNHTHI